MSSTKKESAGASAAAKTLPKNLEAEQSLLGCILVDSDIAAEVSSLLSPADFFYRQNRLVAEAMLAIAAQNTPVDLVTLADRLERENKFEDVGGLNYLNTLAQCVPSSANHAHYLEIVRRCSSMRALIHSCTEIIEDCYTSDDRENAIANAEAKIYKIGAGSLSGDVLHLREAAISLLARIEEKIKSKSGFSGVPTGFRTFDARTNGFQKGNLVILAALTGVGKSSMALNMAAAAAKGGKSVAIFSLEMPKEEVAQRILCNLADVSMSSVSAAKLTDAEWLELWNANELLGRLNMYIDDSSMNTPAQILSKCRRLKSRYGLDFIIIDYLQLMNADGSGKSKFEGRQHEISEITRNLKIYAKELNVPILALSQLSREAAKRSIKENKEPVLSDLRESGAIEQDADIVLFIYKPYEEVQDEADTADVDLIIAKNRSGPLGRIAMTWQGDRVRFIEKQMQDGISGAAAVYKKQTEGLKKLYAENKERQSTGGAAEDANAAIIPPDNEPNPYPPEELPF